MADAAAWRPLRYRPRSVGDMQILALDPAGPGRIVEVFGDLAVADHVAVVVPGNAQSLADYPYATGGAALRRTCLALHATLRGVAAPPSAAVVAWLGYRCPVGLRAAATPAAAIAGAADLRELTRWLPATTHVTLIGHSYGSLVCALAADGGQVDDLGALASPGLGVRHAAQLPTTARIWAARGVDDWVRLLPQVRIGRYGHGRQPTHPRFGANVLACPDTRGHSGYYTPGSRTLQTIADIALGVVPGVSTVVPAPEGSVRPSAL